jgi:hypothetical protein
MPEAIMKIFKKKYRIITSLGGAYQIQYTFCFLPFWLTYSYKYNDLEYTKYQVAKFETDDAFKPLVIYGEKN